MTGKVIQKRKFDIHIELLLESNRVGADLLDSRVVVSGLSELDEYEENDKVVFSSDGKFLQKMC